MAKESKWFKTKDKQPERAPHTWLSAPQSNLSIWVVGSYQDRSFPCCYDFRTESWHGVQVMHILVEKWRYLPKSPDIEEQ